MSLFETNGSSDIRSSIGSIVSSVLSDQRQKKHDPEKEYLAIPAPNVIEFVHSPQYLNIPSVFKHKRQYQILRDLFQYRCPICNPMNPDAIDCWDKDREYLESENLLVWSMKYNDDVCPKCGTTRTEFIQDGLLVRYNQLHGIVGMRSLSLDSMIITNKGLLKLEEMLPDDIEPFKMYNIDYNIIGENGEEPASNIYYEDILESKIITTKLNYRIEISNIHPLRIVRSDLKRRWIKAKDLKINDYVMLYRGPISWPKNELIIQVARTLGYLIGDGSVASKSIDFINTDEELIKDFTICANTTFNSNIDYFIENKNGYKIFRWRKISKKSESILRNYGVKSWYANTKEVPLSIRQSGKQTVCEFLKAYFSSDGWVSLSNSGKYKKPQVGFDTVSYQLALQIRTLLLNLGIITTLSKTKSRYFSKSNKKFNHFSYMVRINTNSINLFYEHIGFLCSNKQKILKRCVDWVNNHTHNSNINIINNSGLLLRKYLNTIDKNYGCKLDKNGNVYQNSKTVELIEKKFYGSVRACWKNKTKAVTRSIISIVLNATRELGEKYCPDLLNRLNEFLDENWVYLPISSIKDGKCEMADIHVPKNHNFIANGILNHNSGKTATVGMIGAYVEHRLINIALTQPDCKLANYFGVLPKQPFEITYIASTEVQSNDTIWAYYKSFRIDSPWFRRYVKWVKKEQRNQDTPEGMEKWVYKETIREIENGHMYVKFNSKNSNSGGLAGRTRIASFVDELCRFKQTESSLGADEAYRVMENSLRTVRSAVNNHGLINWLGLIASISSPISVEDKGMDLLYKSTNIKKMYSFHYATWEFNPEEKREYYDEAYEKDPVGTERDFGAKPPLAANPLVIDPDKFEERAVDLELSPTAIIEVMPFIDKTGQRYHKAMMTECALRRDASRYVVFDAGQNFDSFAGACGHLEIKQLEDDIIEYITTVDWVMRVLPSEEMEVWFDASVDIIKTLKQRQKIAKVEFDRWNSVTLIQQIRNTGVHAEQKSIKPEHFINFVADSLMGRVRLLPKEPDDDDLDPPFKSPAAVGIYEIERLERSIDDKKIYNPQKGKKRGWNSDDVAVVLVHLHHLCQDSQVMPTGAKLRSREARLKREEIGGQHFQMGQMGRIFSPAKSGIGGMRRW